MARVYWACLLLGKILHALPTTSDTAEVHSLTAARITTAEPVTEYEFADDIGDYLSSSESSDSSEDNFDLSEEDGFFTESTRINYHHTVYLFIDDTRGFQKTYSATRNETVIEMLSRFQRYELIATRPRHYDNLSPDTLHFEIMYAMYRNCYEFVAFKVPANSSFIENVKSAVRVVSAKIANRGQKL